ncbi:MAG: phosphotransferase [Oscillospiraceae bacterium]|nr:phosphotransferase [Oscillospiraceae bacterium]
MKDKKEIKININDFPQELHYIFENAKVYDSSSHPTMTVLYSENGYYVKIGEKGSLTKEAEMAKLFERNGMGVEVVSYISETKDYMVTKPAKGEDCTHYLNNPENLCEVLAETMKFLHSRPVADIPVSSCMETYAGVGFMRQDTFIHGDFCLPNIMLDNWKFNAFIDVGLSGVGDWHIDIYWALWSLNYNLKTDKYTDYFLDLYGRDNYDKDVLKKVAEIESQA